MCVISYSYGLFLYYKYNYTVLFWEDAEMGSGGSARGGSSFGWRGAAARRRCKKVLQEHLDNFIAAVFPRGSKKRKSNNDDKHGHGQEKRRPSTLC